MGTKRRLEVQIRIVRGALCRHEEGLTYGGTVAETAAMAERARAEIEKSHEADLAALIGSKRERAIRRFAENPWVVRPVKGDQLGEVLVRLLERGLVRIEPKRGPGTPDARYVDLSRDFVRVAWAYAIRDRLGPPGPKLCDPDGRPTRDYEDSVRARRIIRSSQLAHPMEMLRVLFYGLEGPPVPMRAWATSPLRVPSYIEAAGSSE